MPRTPLLVLLLAVTPFAPALAQRPSAEPVGPALWQPPRSTAAARGVESEESHDRLPLRHEKASGGDSEAIVERADDESPREASPKPVDPAGDEPAQAGEDDGVEAPKAQDIAPTTPRRRASVPNDYSRANRHVDRAQKLLQENKYEAALAEFMKAEAAAPGDGYYAALTGHTLAWALARPTEALTAFERAALRGYRNAWLFRETGITRFKLGAWEAALRDLDRSRELAAAQSAVPNERKDGLRELAATCGWLGEVYLSRRQYSRALEVTDAALRADPQSDDWYLLFARTRAALRQAHRAFAGEQYAEAERLYALAEEARGRNKSVAESTLAWEIPAHLETVRERARLGNIRPDYVHRLLALYVARVKVDFRGLKNERIRAETALTAEQREDARINQALLARYVETWSGGRFSLRFDERELDATLREVAVSSWYSVESRTPVLESIQPDPGDLFYEVRDRYDTLVVYWNGEQGLATTANGGGTTYPYVPYQLYGALRGYMSIPANWTGEDSNIVLLHEFFHVVEIMTGILPTHGFEDGARRNFPGWKGRGQFDYFRYQFRANLPRIQNEERLSKIHDWRNLNFLTRYARNITNATRQANAQAVQAVSLENRARAARLAAEAIARLERDRKGALQKLQSARKLNPYQPDALWYLGDDLQRQGRWEQALAYFVPLVQLRPSAWLYNHVGWIYQWQLKQPEKAADFYAAALKMEDRDPVGYVSYGRALLDLGRAEEGLAVLEECLQATVVENGGGPSTHAQCSFWKGYALGEKLGRPNDARAWVQKAVAEGYRDDFTLHFLEKYSQGQMVAARTLLETEPPDVPRPPSPGPPRPDELARQPTLMD